MMFGKKNQFVNVLQQKLDMDRAEKLERNDAEAAAAIPQTAEERRIFAGNAQSFVRVFPVDASMN